ncbi:MAG: hypothetical protein ACI81P_001656 [Neolewinella sp.]|jgi:hypothetical protein
MVDQVVIKRDIVGFGAIIRSDFVCRGPVLYLWGAINRW